MAIDIDKMMCPLCKGAMKADDDSVRCINCSQVYPILDDVVNFLPQELMEKYNKNFKHQDLFEEHSFYQNLYQDLQGLDDGHCVVYGYDEIYDFMTDIPHGTLLDVGCGAGHHSKDLTAIGFQVTGVDISVNGIQQARKLSDAHGQNTRFCLGDVENLPFEDNAFDVVFCGLIIHHFPRREKLLAEIKRVSKKYFVTFEVNTYDPISFIRFNIINPTIGIHNITKNQRTVSPDKLKKDLERLGFGDFAIKFVDIHHHIGRNPRGIHAKILKTYSKLMKLMPEKFNSNKFILKCSKQ
jgi:SAM-dependent methyltransferase